MKKIRLFVLWVMVLAMLMCGCARVDHDADIDVLMPSTHAEVEQEETEQELPLEETSKVLETEEEEEYLIEGEAVGMEDTEETEESEYFEYPEVTGDDVILYKRDMVVPKPKKYTKVSEMLPDLAGGDYIIFYGETERYDYSTEYGAPHKIHVLESFYGDVNAGDIVTWQAVGMVVQHCEDVIGYMPTPGASVPHGKNVFILEVVERNSRELTCEATIGWFSVFGDNETAWTYVDSRIEKGTASFLQFFANDLRETYLKQYHGEE